MSTHIKMMRFYAHLSVLFLLLTYAVTVNIELAILVINSPWLSNTFLLTVFGGIFTGSILSFMIECKQYTLSKRSTEDSLYKHAAFLFGQLQIAKNSITLAFENKEHSIPSQLLASTSQSIQYCNQALRDIEYIPLNTKSTIYRNQADYIANTFESLLSYTSNCAHFPIIVNKEELRLLSIKRQSTIVTADEPLIHQTLTKLLNETNCVLNKMDSYLITLDTACCKRYNWPENRQSLISGLVTISKKAFED